MKIAVVVVPYITSDAHRELLEHSMESFKSKHDLTFLPVVNAYREQDLEYLHKQFKQITFSDVNCLARSWNIGIRQALWDKCDYILIPNLDVTYTPDTIDALVSCAEGNLNVHMFSAKATNSPDTGNKVDYRTMFDNYSSFLMRPVLVDALKSREQNEPFPGFFDENIRPAYGEDVDYQYRLQLYGFDHIRVEAATYIHHRNGTMRNYPNLANVTDEHVPYLTSKWGGIRDAHYKVPFIG